MKEQALARERLATLDMQAVRDDVSPFLERPQDAALLTRDNLDELIPTIKRSVRK